MSCLSEPNIIDLSFDCDGKLRLVELYGSTSRAYPVRAILKLEEVVKLWAMLVKLVNYCVQLYRDACICDPVRDLGVARGLGPPLGTLDPIQLALCRHNSDLKDLTLHVRR